MHHLSKIISFSLNVGLTLRILIIILIHRNHYEHNRKIKLNYTSVYTSIDHSVSLVVCMIFMPPNIWNGRGMLNEIDGRNDNSKVSIGQAGIFSSFMKYLSRMWYLLK